MCCFHIMALNRRIVFVWIILVLKTESQIINEKRILLTDPDYADNQQIHRDIQLLKATVNHLQTTVNTLNAKVIGQDQQIQSQDKRIQSQASVITTFQNNPSGSTYVRWGKKECPTNGTEIVYSGIGAGGHFSNAGRNTNQICVPHDPDLGKVSHESAYGAVFGMEYETNDFGSNLFDKDVPCAVCRISHASTVLMIPGKSHCHPGWKIEYSGNLMSGHHGHAGASQYVCVDSSPDVLEAGSRDDDGYLLYGVKAYCGSLKCPPYVQDTLFKCVVCSK